MQRSMDILLKTPVTHVFSPGLIQPSVVEAAAAADINALVKRVFVQLPLDVPFVAPKHIAPILGMTQNQFTYHCRNCKELRNWRGSYRFFTDDADHTKALAAVIKLALWSARKLPADLKLTPSKARVH